MADQKSLTKQQEQELLKIRDEYIAAVRGAKQLENLLMGRMHEFGVTEWLDVKVSTDPPSKKRGRLRQLLKGKGQGTGQ